MRILGSLIYFVLGGIVGALAGAAIAVVLAPQSGEQTKQKIQDRVEAGRNARQDAESQTAAAMRQRFRLKVDDPTALSGMTMPPPAPRP